MTSTENTDVDWLLPEEEGEAPGGAPLLGVCNDITIFPLFFPYFSIPLRSVASTTLHSTPPLTHNLLIFPYFIDCCHALHFSAPLC